MNGKLVRVFICVALTLFSGAGAIFAPEFGARVFFGFVCAVFCIASLAYMDKLGE